MSADVHLIWKKSCDTCRKFKRQLDAWGFTLVDCQAETEHLGTFGAEHWPRPRFLATLAEGLGTPTRLGPWELTIGDVTG